MQKYIVIMNINASKFGFPIKTVKKGGIVVKEPEHRQKYLSCKTPYVAVNYIGNKQSVIIPADSIAEA